MTREEVLQKMVGAEPDSGKWVLIERYADLLSELERMLGDREMGMLVDVRARLVRASNPEMFRTVPI